MAGNRYLQLDNIVMRRSQNHKKTLSHESDSCICEIDSFICQPLTEGAASIEYISIIAVWTENHKMSQSYRTKLKLVFFVFKDKDGQMCNA